MSTSAMKVVHQLGPAVCLSSDVPEFSPEINRDEARQYRALQLQERVRRGEILEGRDALEYLRFLRFSPLPEPAEKQIDIQSLEQELARLIPRDTHLTRRARKLAWQLAKGRSVTCDWDIIFLSELTPAENRMSDDEFLALYSDETKTRAKKGGRPRKYKTAKAARRGHADRQRRYRERNLLVISGVTKTPSQFIER